METHSGKILIVDDDPDIVLAIVFILEDAGYTVISTAHGDVVPRLIETERPVLIILDMLLSGYDGREITKRLKSQEVTRRIPILMLSAHPQARQEAVAAGADAFLAKPFDLDELLSQVRAHVG